MKSVFWLIAFFFSLVLLAAAYYVTQPSMRAVVDARTPVVRGFLGPYVRGGDLEEPAPVAETAPALPPPPPAAPPPTAPPVPPVPSKPAVPEPFDLKKLAADRAAWPSKITLTKAKDFPAVVEGKVVGSLTAPAGTEVDIKTISGGKIGVEYRGGGAWVFVEETDVIARTQRR